MNPDELHLFYEDLVRTLRGRGVLCAITGGLACVNYGVAETTKDCDLLCHPDAFGARIRILERHLRPYVSAVRKARVGRQLSLKDEHALRIDCATRHLPHNPLKDYGLEKYISETRKGLAESGLIHGEALAWLPEVMMYFEWLNK